MSHDAVSRPKADRWSLSRPASASSMDHPRREGPIAGLDHYTLEGSVPPQTREMSVNSLQIITIFPIPA